jgi:hypothetical protein
MTAGDTPASRWSSVASRLASVALSAALQPAGSMPCPSYTMHHKLLRKAPFGSFEPGLVSRSIGASTVCRNAAAGRRCWEWRVAHFVRWVACICWGAVACDLMVVVGNSMRYQHDCGVQCRHRSKESAPGEHLRLMMPAGTTTTVKQSS